MQTLRRIKMKHNLTDFKLLQNASHHNVRPAVGPPKLLFVDTAVILSEVKRPGREGNLSPPSDDEFLNVWRHTSTPPYVCVALYLNKHEGQLYLYLTSFLLLDS